VLWENNLTREQALALVEEHIKNKNLRKHCLAMEAVLRHLAKRFDEDEETWGLTGLLHDIDYEITEGNPETHAVVGAEMLESADVDPIIIHAVLGHNDKAPRETLLDKAVYAADPLTGLIVAAALIKPEKKLSAIDTEFVINRFKEKGFARSASREAMMTCTDINLTLEELVGISIKAMREISNDLGL